MTTHTRNPSTHTTHRHTTLLFLLLAALFSSHLEQVATNTHSANTSTMAEELRDLDAQLRGSSTYDREDAEGIFVPPDAFLDTPLCAPAPQVSASEQHATLSAIEHPRGNSAVDRLLSGTRVVENAADELLATRPTTSDVDLDDLFSFGPPSSASSTATAIAIPSTTATPSGVVSPASSSSAPPSTSTTEQVIDFANYLDTLEQESEDPPVLF
jgi:hypothetical protein